MIDLKLTRLAAPLCLAISLGACAANQEWASPQTGIKATEADIAQCEIAARNEAWRSGSAVDSFTAARYAGTFDSRFANEPIHRSTMNPQAQEIRMRDMCMEAKGYQSVAVVNGEPQWGPDQLPLAAKPLLLGAANDPPAVE